jgi:aconitate hydratase
MAIHDAATAYAAEGTPLIVLAGEEYGNGSSRDWAAKGPRLLGVRAVVARSFERIHRSNLVGMGILPCQFIGDDSVQSLGLDGRETFDLTGIGHGVHAQQQVGLVVTGRDGRRREVRLLARVDTAVEADYFNHGGILPFVLRELIQRASAA